MFLNGLVFQIFIADEILFTLLEKILNPDFKSATGRNAKHTELCSLATMAVSDLIIWNISPNPKECKIRSESMIAGKFCDRQVVQIRCGLGCLVKGQICGL